MAPDSPHPACLAVDVLLAQCAERRGRASGPGGQHRNKVETAVVLEHLPTGLRGAATERRSQAQNRREAIRRLRLALATEVRSQTPSATPSELWRARRAGRRIACSARHDDFPALLAEALDALSAAGWVQRVAADALGVSATQLTRLVHGHGAAWALLNHARAAAGLPPLRG